MRKVFTEMKEGVIIGKINKSKVKIIFVGNYKGGVGKTTSVLNFAHIISEKYSEDSNDKVLVIDVDPQSSLSEILSKNNSEGVKLSELEHDETLNYIYDLNIRKIKKYQSLDFTQTLRGVKNYRNKFDFIASSLFYKNGGLDELVTKMEDNIEYLSF